MAEKPTTQISIWFFIGALLTIYGVLIFGASLMELSAPPSKKIVLSELRAGVWWGLLLLVLGGFYSWRFAPRRQSRNGHR